MTPSFAQTIIISQTNLMDTIARYEDHGYQVKSYRHLEKDVNVFVVQFMKRNVQFTEQRKFK